MYGSYETKILGGYLYLIHIIFHPHSGLARWCTPSGQPGCLSVEFVLPGRCVIGGARNELYLR